MVFELQLGLEQRWTYSELVKIVKIYEQEGRIYFLNIATGQTNLRTVKLKKI